MSMPDGTKRIALGTVQFGLPYGVANKSGQTSPASAKTMLQLASANGLDMLDTAVAYGESESCLGALGTAGFKVVTKLPGVPEGCRDVSGWMYAEVSASLQRLGVLSVYGLLLHRPEQLLGPDGPVIYRALQDLKHRGIARRIGISIYGPQELESLISKYAIDLVQAPFSLVDRRLLASGWMRRLKDNGTEVHVRSVFLQGLLLMSRGMVPAYFGRWNRLWDVWSEWLSDHSCSPLRACLSYVLACPDIDRVVVGADNEAQLTEIIAVARAPFFDSVPDICCNDEGLVNPSRWGMV